MMTSNNTYVIDELVLDQHTIEMSIRHSNWVDLQMDTEAMHILVSPEGVFAITDRGLASVSGSDDLWDCIPKIDDINLDVDPHFADFREAKEIVKGLEERILEICPTWGKAIPGRRPSRSR